MKELRDRIDSVQNTKKITEAMKLVAAAKVRRAQEAVVNGRPFAENLVKVRTARSYRLQLVCHYRQEMYVLVVAVWLPRGVLATLRGLRT